MADYTLKQLNDAARSDPKGFIKLCEDYYRNQVDSTVRELAARRRTSPIVLVNGPSSAGKTTTTARLRQALEKRHGIKTKTISMDDYYRTSGEYETPFDEENGVDDLESPLCMNLGMLTDHLRKLAAGEEISVPVFDFHLRKSIPDSKKLRLEPGEMVIIEGIHALSDIVYDGLGESATGVFLSFDSALTLENGIVAEPFMLRFMRRTVRDSLFRNTPVSATIAQWKSVRRGERLYIMPNRGRAALTLDTYMPYETFIIAEMLRHPFSCMKEELTAAGLEPLTHLDGCFEPLDYVHHIPEDSLIHEFIGYV